MQIKGERSNDVYHLRE